MMTLGIEGTKNDRNEKMEMGKEERTALEQIVGLNQMEKCNPAVFCKQMHGSDFQIFAPSDSLCKLRNRSNR